MKNKKITSKRVGNTPKCYLMRWNPEISDYSLDKYRELTAKHPESFGMRWSIYDYKEAKERDFFYMLREGEENGGIIIWGIFSSDPFEGEDWRGSGKKSHYINMHCVHAENADTKPPLSLSLLEKEIPEINWRKGHSGESLTPEQTFAIETLRTGIYNDEEDSFDADAGHGAHLSCFDKDIESVIAEIGKIIHHSKPYDSANDVVTDEGISDLTYMSTKGKDLKIHTILRNDTDSLEVLAFVPYAVNDRPVRFRLVNIQEYSNEFEGVLTVKYGDTELSFFDIEYGLHKELYQVGEDYNFALSAMAYNADCVPEGEMTVEMSGDEAMRLHLSDRHDEPATLSLDHLVAFLQLDKSYPDDGEFWSPVMSRVKKVPCLGREFYRMEICIVNENDSMETLNIPLIARISDFDKKPTMKNSVRGNLWLQGRLIEEGA